MQDEFAALQKLTEDRARRETLRTKVALSLQHARAVFPHFSLAIALALPGWRPHLIWHIPILLAPFSSLVWLRQRVSRAEGSTDDVLVNAPSISIFIAYLSAVFVSVMLLLKHCGDPRDPIATALVVVTHAVSQLQGHMSGLLLMHCAGISIVIGAAYQVNEQWSELPHGTAMRSLWSGLVLGDLVGFILFGRLVDTDPDASMATVANTALDGVSGDITPPFEVHLSALTLSITPLSLRDEYRAYALTTGRPLLHAVSNGCIGLVACAMAVDDASRAWGPPWIVFFLALCTASSAAVTLAGGESVRAAHSLGKACIGATACLSATVVHQIALSGNGQHAESIPGLAHALALGFFAGVPTIMCTIGVPDTHARLCSCCLLVSLVLGVVALLSRASFALSETLRYQAHCRLISLYLSLCVGVLLGHTTDGRRKSAWCVARTAAEAQRREAAAAEAEAAAADARELEQRRIDAANRAADSRLNHVIKGHCLTLAAGIDAFEEALPKYLREPLPKSVSNLLSLATAHLRDVANWSHRREMLLQQERGEYRTVRTPVQVGEVLRSLVLVGETVAIDSALVAPLRVDEGVLRLAVEETLINSRRHGADGSVIVRASFEAPMLRVVVENRNRAGAPRLTAEACRTMMQSATKGGSSATSDGIGLSSVDKAVRCAGGTCHLGVLTRDGADFTLMHVNLPADTIAAAVDASSRESDSSQKASEPASALAIATASADASADASAHASPPPHVRGPPSAASSTTPSQLRLGAPGQLHFSGMDSFNADSFSSQATSPPKLNCSPSRMRLSDTRIAVSPAMRRPSKATSTTSFTRAKKPLVCIAVDTQPTSRKLLHLVLHDLLGADDELSVELGGSEQEQSTLSDLAIGRGAVETPTLPQLSEVDVVCCDASLVLNQLRHGPRNMLKVLSGVDLIRGLRERGFSGLACIVTGDSDAKALNNEPEIDMVIMKGTPVPEMAAAIQDGLACREAMKRACTVADADTEIFL